jgi:hypothetical protein
MDGAGNVTSTPFLNNTCGEAAEGGCASLWHPVAVTEFSGA